MRDAHVTALRLGGGLLGIPSTTDAKTPLMVLIVWYR
jgi:hypothetical protein